jgi:hypothetical protein
MEEEFFKKGYPEGTLLYHYTTLAGYMGMRQSKSLWLSNILYQNDLQEYEYAKDLITKVFWTYKGLSYPSDILSKFGHDVPPFFTFSLSENGDLLSQWRGYCPSGGVSISIHENILKDTISFNGLSIGKCIYEENEQISYIKKYIIQMEPDEWLETVERFKRMTKDYAPFFTVYNRILMHTPFIKHPAFKEEQEWRLIKSFKDVDEVKRSAKVRERNNNIIPYIVAPLKHSEKELDVVPLRKLIVGPSPNSESIAKACRLIPENAEIVQSTIPYKNW